VDWNNDGKKDIVAGDKTVGKLHLFINEGTDTAPDFLVEAFVQRAGADMVVPSARPAPDVYDWNGDGKKDLLVGNTEGNLLFYPNVGTDAAPAFSNWFELRAGGIIIDLPGVPRSRPFVCDWTGDGIPDVLLGAGSDTTGLVRLYQGVGPVVPTLPEWGLIAMGMLLAGMGARFLRRRSAR
jgi:hypothetical protein